jgi:hypothetical protein
MEPIVRQNVGLNLTSKSLDYIRSFFTWKGRDITLFKDEDFLSQHDWEHNLKLFAEFNITSPIAALMDKETYQWLPEHSCVSEGYIDLKEKFETLSSKSYTRWLTAGPMMVVFLLFCKAMQLNYDCLARYEVVTDDMMRECRIHYGSLLCQPATISKVAVVGGAWAFGGWLIKSFGDFGLRGLMTQRRLHNNLIKIYQITADSARNAFWDAIDRDDKATAHKIHVQLDKIKAILPYLKEIISTELGVEEISLKKMTNHFNLFIEEVKAYDNEKQHTIDNKVAEG